MKILLVSATEFEILPVLGKMKKRISGEALFSCRLGKHSIDVLIAGIGMTATAFHLGRVLTKKYDLAINAGVAGSFKKEISPGTVVNVTHDCFADLGAEDGHQFLTLKEMGLNQNVKFKPAVVTHHSSVVGHLVKVKGITVNTVHGNEASIKKAVKKFNPDIESMEGAAFFFACNYFKTPCIQMRAISNYVEKRNKKNWKLKLAIKNLNTHLNEFFAAI